MNSLELIKLNKHYGRKHALKNFSFTFTNGIYGLLGPNGAGKSTLMHLITGILHPDKGGGSINWNGKPIHQLGKSYREHLGFMPQQQELYSNMTAVNFLGYAACVGISFVLPGMAAVYAMLAAGLFHSVMWPLIFNLGLQELGPHTKAASGIINMGVIGAATLPLLMGVVVDHTGVGMAICMMFIYYLYVIWFCWK